MKKNDKKLQATLERALTDLLSGKNDKTKTREERDEIRQNINAATKFLAVRHKLVDNEWGSGFTNGATKGEDDAGTDDD